MSAAAGPGPVPVNVDDLPEGWEAFGTNDAEKYFCFPEVYYYCRGLKKVQWARPGFDDAQDPYEGPTIGGKPPYEKGNELIPEPPAGKPDDTNLADDKYAASCEDPDDLFQPDEDMLEACLEGDLKKLQQALGVGADVSIPNIPWTNTPLHLANVPPFWDAETISAEKQQRLELTQWLVRQGADTEAENSFNCKPIDFAAFHGYPESVQFLEAQGCKLGWFGAAFMGNLPRIKELLEDGQDIDQKGRFGRTAWFEAKLRGHWEVQAFLSQLGCSKEMAHPETLKFTAGGASFPRGVAWPAREKQYYRSENPEWYDDMMEKRFPGYTEKIKHRPKELM
jgi:hypothetical protein